MSHTLSRQEDSPLPLHSYQRTGVVVSVDEVGNADETYQYLTFVGIISIGNPSNVDVIRETHPIPVTFLKDI